MRSRPEEFELLLLEEFELLFFEEFELLLLDEFELLLLEELELLLLDELELLLPATTIGRAASSSPSSGRGPTSPSGSGPLVHPPTLTSGCDRANAARPTISAATAPSDANNLRFILDPLSTAAPA